MINPGLPTSMRRTHDTQRDEVNGRDAPVSPNRMIPQHMMRNRIYPFILLLAWLPAGTAAFAADVPVDDHADFKNRVMPFFEANCISCHGPKKSKGKITLHTLEGGPAGGKDLEHWETILDVLKSGEMPPEDEPQPAKADRDAIVKWIEAGMRDQVAATSQAERIPTTRRLTNFEYQNTMRDLFGFELDLIKNLPNDPLKPYHFNNTAEFMLIGPEQMDAYRENARRMLASVIVDPRKPEVHRTKLVFSSD